MSYTENFDSDEGDFVLVDEVVFDSLVGNPNAGSLRFEPGTGVATDNTITYQVQEGDVCTFQYRLINCDQLVNVASFFIFTIDDNDNPLTFSLDTPIETSDTGWVQGEIDLSSYIAIEAVIESIQINGPPAQEGFEGFIRVDTIYIGQPLSPEPSSVGKLWVYKTLDNGQSWSSKGVHT